MIFEKIQDLVIYSLICCLMTGLLAGCAEKSANKEVLTEVKSVVSCVAVSGDAASQKVVSGGGISEETVSGSAVQEEDEEETVYVKTVDGNEIGESEEEKKTSALLSVHSFSPLCNSTNYYELQYKKVKKKGKKKKQEVTYVYERRLDGTLVKRYEMEDFWGYDSCLLWADDRELFYCTQYERSECDTDEILWCVPIRKTENDDELLWEKQEEILRIDEIHEGDFWSEYFYADEQYILFISGLFELRVYDRKKGDYIYIKNPFSSKQGLPNNLTYNDYPDSIQMMKWKDVFYIHTKYNGIYSYKLGDEKVERVAEGSLDDNGKEMTKGDIVYGAYSAILYKKGGKLLYQIARKDGKEKDDDGKMLWMSYDCGTKKKEVFHTVKEWKEIFQNHVTNPEPYLFLDGDDLYALSDYTVMRLDMTKKNEPEYLEKLSTFLKKQKLHWYDVEFFENDRCYLNLREDTGKKDEDGEIIMRITGGYYDLKQNKFVELVRR